MKKLIAVSGGIDSVVLLDMLAKSGEEIIVAHFDHGIRRESAADARFVKLLAEKYTLPFVARREELGEGASEALARVRRYAFLQHEARGMNATIVTAHHADDVIETIAINLMRGTGWRGLAVLDSPEIDRPLLHTTKTELYAYALKHRLEWVEDSTNVSQRYARNRIRAKIARHLGVSSKKALRALWNHQLAQKKRIEAEVRQLLLSDSCYRRYFFIMIPTKVAIELLQSIIVMCTGKGLQRPQLEHALLAIKTFQAGAMCDVGDGVTLCFSQHTFIVKLPVPVV